MKTSFARMDAFALGQIVAFAGEGRLKAPAIRKKAKKKDGLAPIPHAVRDAIAKAAADPEWRGGQPGGPGRKQGLFPSQPLVCPQSAPAVSPQSAPQSAPRVH